MGSKRDGKEVVWMRKRWIFILAAVLGAVGIALRWNRRHGETVSDESGRTGTIGTPVAA